MPAGSPSPAPSSVARAPAGAPAGAPRWARRKDQRPAEVLAAALELFVERGYAATRLDDVAARAGVSKGTLYLYFPNKEELFKALVRETLVAEIERFRREMADSDATAAQRVRATLHRWWNVFGSTQLGGIAKLIMAEAGNFPAVAQFCHDEVVEPTQQGMQDILAAGMASGEFRDGDARVLARLLLAPMLMKTLWQQSFARHCTVGREVDAHELIDTHLDITLAHLLRTGP